MTKSKKTPLSVSTPIDRKDGGTFWLRIGGAFKNDDGSQMVYLDALPVNGKLYIAAAPEEGDTQPASDAKQKAGA